MTSSSEIVSKLLDRHKHSAEAYGCEEYMPMAKFWQSYADLSAEAASHIEAQALTIAEMRMELVATAEFLTDLLRQGDDMAADARLYSIDRALSKA